MISCLLRHDSLTNNVLEWDVKALCTRYTEDGLYEINIMVDTDEDYLNKLNYERDRLGELKQTNQLTENE